MFAALGRKLLKSNACYVHTREKADSSSINRGAMLFWNVLLTICVLELICEVLCIFWRDSDLGARENGSHISASGDSSRIRHSRYLKQ
jgi:hypothetical protein